MSDCWDDMIRVLLQQYLRGLEKLGLALCANPLRTHPEPSVLIELLQRELTCCCGIGSRLARTLSRQDSENGDANARAWLQDARNDQKQTPVSHDASAIHRPQFEPVSLGSRATRHGAAASPRRSARRLDLDGSSYETLRPYGHEESSTPWARPGTPQDNKAAPTAGTPSMRHSPAAALRNADQRENATALEAQSASFRLDTAELRARDLERERT